MNDRFQARSGYSKDVNFKTANSSNRPGAASELAMKIEEMLKNRVKNHLH